MKRVFDDIRSEVEFSADEACFMPDDMMIVPVSKISKILDEAEAKWEADCCVWKEISWNVYNAHERFVGESILKEWTHCPY